MITQWQIINWKVGENQWIQKRIKIQYFKRFSLRKINILKFAGEILSLPLEIMSPLSLHTLLFGTAVPGIDEYSRAKICEELDFST